MVPILTEAEAKKSAKKAPFWEGRNLRDMLGMFVGPMLLLPFAVAFVGVVVASEPSLQEAFPVLLSTVIMSQTLSSYFYVAFSQFRTCSNVDLLSAACIGKMIGAVKLTLPKADFFVYTVICQGFFTASLGFLLVLVAYADGIWFLRFLPYTVSSGFVMGIGFLIADGGFELGVGAGMKELAMAAFEHPIMTHVHTATTILSAMVMLSTGRFVDNSFKMPVSIFVVTILFYGSTRAMGIPLDWLQENSFFLSGLTGESWTTSWTDLTDRFAEVGIRPFMNSHLWTIIASYMMLHVLCFSFYAAALTEVDRSTIGKPVTLKKEVYTLGACNLMCGLIGGVPVAHSIKALVVMQDIGGRSKLWSLLVALAFSCVYFSDLRVYIAIVPRCAFGGLVASLGFEFIHGSYHEAYERIASNELRIVFITAIVTWFDVLSGLAFGLLTVAGSFIVEYAGMTGINRRESLETVRSNIDRSAEEKQVLDSHGDKVVVFWLTGYIFFGSAVSAVERIEKEVNHNPSIDHLIVDFENVPAVDASGVHHFTNFALKCLMHDPPIRVCFSGTVRRLKNAVWNVCHSKKVDGLRCEGDLIEEALSWAEESVLTRHCGTPKSRKFNFQISPIDVQTPYNALILLFRTLAPSQTEAAIQAVASRLKDTCNLRNFDEGDEIFGEGEAASMLYFILRGSVVLHRKLRKDDYVKLPEHHLNKEKGDQFMFEERTRVRVQQVREGAILGAAELSATHAKKQWTTSATSSNSSQVLSVPFDAFNDSIAVRPEVGLVVTQQIARILSSHMVRLLRKSEASPFVSV